MAVKTAMGLGPVAQGAESEKTPSTRLLDMLAGWSRYAQHDTENGVLDRPYREVLIENLYQKAAAQQFGTDSAGDTSTEWALREFLINEVLPAIMHKTPGTRD